MTVTALEAWAGALSYTFQLYFDFSGYSDMAIGLGRLFGVRIPINFHSPYKAVHIAEFWQRWHMTLTRFLRDYLFVPLGRAWRRPSHWYARALVVMLLSGLWHGAGWTFIAWGGLHGLYLMVHHAWQALTGGAPSGGRAADWAARTLTFLAVVAAWVLFRADDIAAAQAIYRGMGGWNGVALPVTYDGLLGEGVAGWFTAHGGRFEYLPYFGGKVQLAVLLLLWLFVWLAPNTQEVMRYAGVSRAGLMGLETPTRRASTPLRWAPTLGWALAAGGLAVAAVILMSQPNVFLYFQF
jgi:hypothetical protein